VDSDSLTETKNWRDRNEVIETSGRLHPLWPQNKRLHTPWTTDWMHTRQDRRIETELAFILAKNATKPNPFEIISLQTTRKENNWKTKETLARAVVTLETKRIKGSKAWCLWWCVQTERLGRAGVQKTLLKRLQNKELPGKENAPRYAAVNETMRWQPAVSGTFCAGVQPLVVCIAHKLTSRISWLRYKVYVTSLPLRQD